MAQCAPSDRIWHRSLGEQGRAPDSLAIAGPHWIGVPSQQEDFVMAILASEVDGIEEECFEYVADLNEARASSG